MEATDRPRFVSATKAQSLYESFYLRAHDPAWARGVWIRYTVRKPPGLQPAGHLWFTFFDRSSKRPRASKQAHPADSLSAGGGELIHIADSKLSRESAVGKAVSADMQAEWKLTYTSSEEKVSHLPYGWMYRSAVPRTKLETLSPLANFEGELTLDEQTIQVDRWPGMVGHNWGSEHADQWVWLHGLSFDQSQDAWLDVVLARVRLGGVRSPWIAAGWVSLHGTRHRLGGLRHAASTRVLPTTKGCEFSVAGRSVAVRGTVTTEPSATVGWRYGDPKGAARNVCNCSVATMNITVKPRAQRAVELTSPHGTAYEFGTSGDLDIALEPFADD